MNRDKAVQARKPCVLVRSDSINSRLDGIGLHFHVARPDRRPRDAAAIRWSRLYRPMVLNVVERKLEPDITVLEISGRLALGRESQRIETMVEELSRKGSARVVLDLTGVDYIDSAGIGMLALAAGKVKEAGGTMAIVAPEGRVLQLLNLTQLNLVVKVSPTVAAATAGM